MRRTSCWKVVESLSNICWKGFIKEYIPPLNVRKKINKMQTIFKVNDIFLTYHSNMPRLFWALARIISFIRHKTNYCNL